MPLSRRDFLKIMGGSTAAVLLPTVLIQGCKRALKKLAQQTNVLWLRGLSCDGCSVSLMNSIDPDILSLVTHRINLDYHHMLMAGSGSEAIAILNDAAQQPGKGFVLIVEGAIPTRSDVMCTLGLDKDRQVGIKQWLSTLENISYNSLKAVIAVGTCAAYGGVAAARNNLTGAVGVREIIKPHIRVINIPGCPPHPDWIAGTLLHLLLFDTIPTDSCGRPTIYFGTTVHDNCEHLYDYKRGKFAQYRGDAGCLYNLGCLGIDSGCDIPKRKWLNGAASCTNCGTGCIGCTEKEFPDFGKRGLFARQKAFIKE